MIRKNSISGEVAKLSKQKIIPAVVTDILGEFCSVCLSTTGMRLHGIKYIGPTPEIGSTAYVNYQSGTPIVYTLSEYIASSDTGSDNTATNTPPLPGVPLPFTPTSHLHNDHAGIQGGIATDDEILSEYYHLSYDQYSIFGREFLYEDLTSQVNGIETSFVLSFPVYTLIVFYNGLALTPDEYTIGATRLYFTLDFAPLDGDNLTVAYLINTLSLEEPELPQDNLVLWLKPETRNGTMDDTPISLWQDSGLYNFDAISTGDSRPLHQNNQINGNAILRFDGVDDKLSITGINAKLGSAAHLFIIVKITDDVAYNLYNHSATIDGWWKEANDGKGYMSCFRSVRLEAYPNEIMPIDGVHLFELRSDDTNYEELLDQVSYGIQASDHDVGDSVHTIGCMPTDQVGFDAKYLCGDIAEIIIYSTIQTGEDLAAIYSYLYEKYNYGELS